uniref:7TM GPCR serpentine receptor class x (Srx) domain-containing protein n=1 Tax=Acrobeloides nanus TaxID=290746 RepID=A0A914EBB0_9BILA
MKKAYAFDGNVMTFLLILVWLPGLSMFITILTPECSMIYYLESTSWDYTNETWCPVINDIDFYYSVGMCAIGAALYFLIFGKLLLMAFTIGGYTIFSEVVWHFANEFIPDELLASFLGNILWIGEAGLTPYIYLLIN